MKNKQDLSGIFLASAVGIAMLAAMFVRAFFPHIIIPRLDGPMIVLLCVTSLVLDHYLNKNSKHDIRFVPIYGALIFGLFPWTACFMNVSDALKSALIGAVIFTVTVLLFDSISERLSDTPASKSAPIISAFGLYLAAQCLMGII